MPVTGKFFKKAALVISLITIFHTAFAQVPVITYQTPQHYIINTGITPLTPTNTGGAVPATGYGQVSTLPITDLGDLTGIAVDASGNLFIQDWTGNVIRKYTTAGVLSIFAGSGKAGRADGQGRLASFSQPDGIITDAAGNIYVGDQTYRLIRKITPTGFVTTLVGSGVVGSADGIGSAASFYYTRGLSIDSAGNIYVADQGNNKIRKVTQAGVVTTIAGNGARGLINGIGKGAIFYSPAGTSIDDAGNLYIADTRNNVIRKITPALVVTTYATGVTFPRDIKLDKAGYAYVTNQTKHTISVISPTGVVTTLAGTGKAGLKDGPGNVATFNVPVCMAIDNKGNLFVTDNVNRRVRKITITGYSIDKPLPAGLIFDTATGVISGTPTALSPLTDYTITAFNLAGSGSTVVKIQVTELQPAIITFPPPVVIRIDPDNILHPGATSTNTETPITYTSSNPSVAYVDADGQIHVIAPGVTIITASQIGNAIYKPAEPVSRTFTIMQDQIILFPAIDTKTTCDIDFSAGAITSNPTIPLTYSSSNPAVATISQSGNIHIIAAGSTDITISQNGNSLFNPAETQTQTLIVTPPEIPIVAIIPDNTSICTGSPVTFIATVTNVSGNLSYQWHVNGVNAGINSASFTTIPVSTTDVYDCVVTNNASCMATGTSNSYKDIIINTYITPSVSISSSSNADVCSGTAIIYTATPTNGGPDQSFQWKVNGINAGTNSPIFTSSTLTNGDIVSCILTAHGVACLTAPTALSNPITANITTSPDPAPSVTITATNNIYVGTPINFIATTANAGNVIKYQWQVNGITVGANSPIYNSSTLKNEDAVTCTVISDIACSIPAISEVLTLNLLPPTAITIPNTFTPNGDGVNDYWNIPALLSYPN
jgi:sugar lactone lactonase YvrE